MKQTILVTGGAGYIGSFTVKELLDNNYNVVVLDSLENGHREAVDSRAKLEVVDLSDKKATSAVFDKYQIDAVIDFAAYLAVGESMEQPEKYMRNNVENFVQLLDVMKEKGCRYIIKSSTAATYGNPADKYFPLKEVYQDEVLLEDAALLPGIWNNKETQGNEFLDQIFNYYKNVFSGRADLTLSSEEINRLRIPTSIYGLTKMLDEIILEKYNQSSDINYISLRYFNVCGAALDGTMGEDKPNPTTLMTVTIYPLLEKGGKLQIFGNDYPTKDGTGVRDYIHPLDLATGHVAALNYLLKTNKSEIFNLGCGRGYSVFEVINAVEKVSGKKVSYDIAPRRNGDPAISYADPKKAETLLGWKAKYSLNDMANSAWKWHSEHLKGYSK